MRIKNLSEYAKKQYLVDECIRLGINEASDGRLLSELTYDELKSLVAIRTVANS